MVMRQVEDHDQDYQIHKFAKQIIQDFCQKTLAQLQCLTGDTLLREWKEKWENYVMFAHAVNKMFSYLNTFFLQGRKKVGEEAFDAFKTLTWTPIRDELGVALMDAISRE